MKHTELVEAISDVATPVMNTLVPERLSAEDIKGAIVTTLNNGRVEAGELSRTLTVVWPKAIADLTPQHRHTLIVLVRSIYNR